MLVCIDALTPTSFTGNFFAQCCNCGRYIQHRPHAPQLAMKVCFGCFLAREREGKA